MGIEQDIFRFQISSVVGLRALARLIHHFPALLDREAPKLVCCLACYTDSDEPWMRPGADESARDLLGPALQHLPSFSSQEGALWIAELLSSLVKPTFASSKPRAITQAGRKAIEPLPAPLEASEDRYLLKPWKYGKFYIVTVLHWLLGELNVSSTYFHPCSLAETCA